MQASSLQDDALVKQYVHVVNDAIGRHRDETPYKQIFSVMQDVDELNAGVALYKNGNTDQPHGHFVLGWTGDKLALVDQGKEGDRTWWSMPREHLEEVVENPEPFLDNPMKLDLDWLTRRLGLNGDGGVVTS